MTTKNHTMTVLAILFAALLCASGCEVPPEQSQSAPTELDQASSGLLVAEEDDWRYPPMELLETCSDDRMEDNDAPLWATPLAVPLLRTSYHLCPGDDDWFDIPVPANTRLEITLVYNASGGSLSPTLHLRGGAYSFTSHRNGGTVTLTSSWASNQGQAPLACQVEVGHDTGGQAGIHYSLQIATKPAVDPYDVPCARDDSFEDNNVKEDATALTDSSVALSGLRSCVGNYDWYRIVV